ncbi:hypothetical protein T09_3865, partial [Trichinella sp. T9]
LLDLGTGSCILVITVTKKNYTSISRNNRTADTPFHAMTEWQIIRFTPQPNNRYSISLHNRMADTPFHATTERQIIRFKPQPNSRCSISRHNRTVDTLSISRHNRTADNSFPENITAVLLSSILNEEKSALVLCTFWAHI